MSIQSIINTATFLTVDKKKVADQAVSRSGRVKTAEVANAVPYRFIVGVSSGYKYSDNRANLEELDRLDVTVEEEVNIGASNAGLAYITAYQGGITGGNLTLVIASALTITVNAANVTGSDTLFKKGDYIQPVGNTGAYRYPYQVTADVPFTTSSSVNIPVHRPVIHQDGVSLSSGVINKGTDVRWHVKMSNKPTYTILPHDRVQLDKDLQLVEIIQ
tara:strand:- start:3981 stop:4631 length:651 start_codon:yes stop_codon:yes gene_type:complete